MGCCIGWQIKKMWSKAFSCLIHSMMQNNATILIHSLTFPLKTLSPLECSKGISGYSNDLVALPLPVLTIFLFVSSKSMECRYLVPKTQSLLQGHGSEYSELVKIVKGISPPVSLLDFHPNDCEIVFLQFCNYVVFCNMQTRYWKWPANYNIGGIS